MLKGDDEMPFKICAFKIDDRRCSALTKKACMRCNFFKTEEEVKASRERAEERIRSLPINKQRAIIDKYILGLGGEDDEP